MVKYPLIKYIVLFIVGILSQSILEIPSHFLFASIIIFILLSVVLKRTTEGSYLSPIIQLILFSLILLSGAGYYSLHNINPTGYPFDKARVADTKIYGEVKSVELIKDRSLDFELVTDSLSIKNKTGNYSTKLLCKLREKNQSNLKKFYNVIEPGNKVIVIGTIQKGRERRNPFEFDYNKYLNGKGISALLYVKSTRDISIVDSSKNMFSSIIFDVRKTIAEEISNYGTPETQALLKGLILADRSGIDYDVRENFVNAGVIHVLAVSGLHVGYIALIFLFLFMRLNIYVRYVLTIAGLFFFVLITGGQPSVVRASIMASVLIVSYMFNRGYNNLNSLALAAFFILLIDSGELFNPGFQLSFSAVLAILMIYPKFKSYLESKNISNVALKNLLLFVSVSLAAQLGTLPFTLYYFHKLSVAALFANLIVIPLIGVVLGLGFVVLLSSIISSWLAFTFVNTLDLASDLLFWIVNVIGSLETSYLYISQFTIYDGIVFYILLITSFMVIPRMNSYRAKILVAVFVVINYMVLVRIDDYELLPDGNLNVMMIDVGQGDSFLVKFPDGKTALIDGGNATFNFDNGERVIYPLLQNLGIEKINYGFISHVDADHYKGLEFFIKQRMIDTIYKPIKEDVSKDSLLEKLIRDNEIELKYYDANTMIVGECNVLILNDTTDTYYKGMDSNNRSGILKILYGDNSFLFVGDAEKPAENYLIQKFGEVLDSDVLKIGHHGSNTSSSRRFVELVSPEIGLISAGMFNKFGHPSPETLQLFDEFNIRLYRTDISGATVLTCDGKTIEIVDWR